jgi:hypothetical protein
MELQDKMARTANMVEMQSEFITYFHTLYCYIVDTVPAHLAAQTPESLEPTADNHTTKELLLETIKANKEEAIVELPAIVLLPQLLVDVSLLFAAVSRHKHSLCVVKLSN